MAIINTENRPTLRIAPIALKRLVKKENMLTFYFDHSWFPNEFEPTMFKLVYADVLKNSIHLA